MDLQKLFIEYLSSNKLLQLATIADGQPWICNLYYVSDADGNLYWTSSRARRHSIEIKADSKTAVTIVQDGELKQSLQITGDANEVPLSDAARVDSLYAKKFGDKPSRLEEVLADMPDGRAYWVLRPRTVSFWDEVNFPDSPKQELYLSA